MENIRVEEKWHENVSVYRARGCLERKVESRWKWEVEETDHGRLEEHKE